VIKIAAMLAAALAASLLAHAPAQAEAPLFSLPDGTYRSVVPPGWDGMSRLPMLLYMHGYGQSSGEVTGTDDLVASVTSLGVLFVVPDGVAHGWSHVGAPRHNRDDLAFLHEVVADAEKHWPVDPAKIYAAGFSIGGSMVWDLACHAASGFAAFLPVSGAFWLPYPEHCESGPVNLRHVHGLTDTTVPMKGRVLFNQFTQGDVMKGWEILRTTDACAVEPQRTTKEEDLNCQEWAPCASGHALELCLHGDGHDMEPRYLHGGLIWAMGLGH
jgi:polyhydroxybutyrate depolymerase